MPEQAQALTRHDLEAKIIKCCWEGEAFHQEFTADPVGTVVRYLQVPAASLLKVVVHEEPSGSWHIVLPSKPVNVDDLSDQELEQIAGGVTPTVLVSMVGGTLATSYASVMVSVGEGGW